MEVLKNYNHNLGDALKAVYPEVPWKFWKFSQVRDEEWSDARNLVSSSFWLIAKRLFFQDLFRELGMTSQSEWSKITEQEVIKYGGQRVLKQSGSIFKALLNAFPGKWLIFLKFLPALVAHTWPSG